MTAFVQGGAAALAVALGAAPGLAATGPWASQEVVPGAVVEARLVAAVDGTADLASVPAGLHIRLPDGWKTYWRSPGDAGLPPRIDWAGSENLADAEMRWPAPHRFTLFGAETFGYDYEVVLPLALRPVEPGEAMALRGVLDLLVCADICVPGRFDLSLDLPAGPAAVDGEAANLIDRYAAAVPGDGRAAGLAIETVAAESGALRVVALAERGFIDPDIFVEAGEFWAFGRPEVTYAEGGKRIEARLPLLQAPEDAPPLAGLPVTLTLVDGDRALEWAGGAGAAAAPSGGRGLLAILGLAVLGGLILNLMPCVLPVLSIKLLSVLGQGGRSPGQVRRSFVAAAAGILASFLALAGVLAALQASGAAVGWGIQFQQPLFLVFMVVVLTLFGSNLLGLFEIGLPRAVMDRAGAMSGRDGVLGDVATGALATLLATPCSAPLLGTAVGFALSRGPVEIFAVFAALAVGLALPYLAVAAVPRLVGRLPRPGAWMVTLRRVLGLALFATAAWLLSVLAAVLSPAAAAVVGLLMVGVVLVLWGRRPLAGRGRLAGGALAGLLALAAFAAPGRIGAAGDTTEAAVPTDWTPFDRPAIARHVADGQVVFVDVTADWCLTCQANKALVLDDEAVAAVLAGEGVVAMQADWTRPDPAIAAYLEAHGRYGIPFYKVYGPAAPQGLTLPELLTENIVLTAFREAGLPSGGLPADAE